MSRIWVVVIVLASCGDNVGGNRPPTVEDLQLATPEDTAITRALAAVDPDGDALVLELGQPQHGTVSANGIELMYLPAANYSGPDQIVATVSDGSATATAQIAIEVTPVNDAPVGTADSLASNEDTTLVVTPAVLLANDTDIEGDSLSVTVANNATNGTVVLGSDIRFTPAANFEGAAGFEYTLSDGTATTVVAVTVTVGGENDAPIALDDVATMLEDGTLTLASSTLVGNDTDADGQTLAVVDAANASTGTVALAGTTIVFTPSEDFYGTASFEYTVSDGTLTDVGTVTVTVGPVNDPPSAADDVASVDEDSPATPIAVLANDAIAPDGGETLTITAVSQPNLGTVSITGMELSYAALPDRNGTDSFTYTISDGNGGTATATVTVAIAPVNDPPTAVDDSVALDEDSPAIAVDVLANDTSSPDSTETLTIASVTQPANGAASIDNGAIRYAPAANFHGSDSFGYTIADGNGGTATATVTLAVAPVNDPPTAADDDATVAEDSGTTTIPVLANDTTAPDSGEMLTIVSVTQPANGTVAIASGGTAVAFAPAANFHGTATFAYTVDDGAGGTATATVRVAIDPVNDPPTAVDDAVTVQQDSAGTQILVLANDTASPDTGETLTITGATQPANGSVTRTSSTVTFTPDAGFSGATTFTYTISDGNGGTATGSVAVRVNAPPAATDDAVTVAEDAAATPIDVLANDTSAPDSGESLTIAAVTQPANGTVTIIGGDTAVAFAPAPNFAGTSSFTYTITDGNGGSATATVAVTVTPINDPPTVANDTATVVEDAAATAIPVLANDSSAPDGGESLSITATTQPANGSVAITGGGSGLTFTPASNFNGTAGFSYTVSDGNGGTASGTVTVTVTPVNDPPTATDDVASIPEDASATTIPVLANDSIAPDSGETLLIISVTQPANGTVAITGGGTELTFAPPANFHGPAELTYTISDGTLTDTATVAITVTPVNDPPTASDDSATVAEDSSATAIPVLANDSTAPDTGETLRVDLVTQPLNGVVTITGGGTGLTFRPSSNFNGTTTFTYRVSDSNGGTATATVTMTVTAVNDPPNAVNDSLTIPEDAGTTAVPVLANDTASPDTGETLTITAVTQPSRGTVSITGGGSGLTYTPPANFNGGTTFTYSIADGNGGTDVATVSVVVVAVDDPPFAIDSSVIVDRETPTSIVLRASDVESQWLVFSIVSGPSHGVLGTIDGSSVTYTSEPGYVGTDSFTFKANDGAADSNIATIAITVTDCGDSVVGVAEECDDGNSVGGDGCERNCQLTCGSGTGASRARVDAATGRCFAAYDGDSLPYKDAASFCRALGAHLPTLPSAAENAAAFAALSSGDTPWIGSDDRITEGTFRLLTGETSSFTSFAPGQPDNLGDQDCLQFTSSARWNDELCTSAAQTTLCEFELLPNAFGFATGNDGRGVVSGDWNGDGRPDIAITGGPGVAVMLGNGVGAFGGATSYTTGNSPRAIIAHDFNGDGHQDFAVANQSSNNVSVLLGTATGTFAAATSYAMGGAPGGLAAGDFNGDNQLDLVVAVTSTNTLALLLGTGAGTFGSASSFSVTGAQWVAAGDLDMDGRVDAAVATNGGLTILLNDNGAGFRSPTTFAAPGGGLLRVALADLDRDGDLDAATVNQNVAIFLGEGNGTFQPATLFGAGANPGPLEIADVNGDARVDLVVASTSGSAFVVLLGTGVGTFTGSAAGYTAGPNPLGVTVTDVDADGHQDVVLAHFGSVARVFMGDGSGTFAAPPSIRAFGPRSVAVADFNNDAWPDAAVGGQSNVTVLLGSATGAFTQRLVSAGPFPHVVAVGDFNNDERPDLVAINPDSNTVSVMRNNGDATFGSATTFATGPSPSWVAVADVNADGNQDIVTTNRSGNTASVLLGLGTGAFSAAVNYAVGTSPGFVTIADLGGDGRLDIVVANAASNSLSVLPGNGDGTFATATTIAVTASPLALAIADLSGDGLLDVAVAENISRVSVLVADGAGGFATTSYSVGITPRSVAIADLDGNGELDLAVAHGSSSPTMVLLGTGSSFHPAQSLVTGLSPHSVGTADFDLDGHLDLVVTHTQSDEVSVLYSSR